MRRASRSRCPIKAHVENLKSAIAARAELNEAQSRADLLIRATSPVIGGGQSQRCTHRHRRWLEGPPLLSHGNTQAVGTFRGVGQAKAEIAGENMEDRLRPEKEDRIEQLLVELKGKRGA